MKRNAAKRRSQQLLQWVFCRGNQLLTCQLEREGHRAAYILSLVPHWDLRQATVENFEYGLIAFRRHAAVADQLRRNGWALASYGAGR